MGGKQSKKSTAEPSSTTERPERQGKAGFSFRFGNTSKRRPKSKKQDEEFSREDPKRTSESGFSRFLKRYATIQNPKEEQRRHENHMAQLAAQRQQENISPRKSSKSGSVASDHNNRSFDTDIQSVADETRSQRSTRSNPKPARRQEKRNALRRPSCERERLSDDETEGSVVLRDKSHNTSMESDPAQMRRANKMIERQSKIMPKEIISQLKNRQTMSVTTSNISRESSLEYVDNDLHEQSALKAQRPKKTRNSKAQSMNENLEMPSLESDHDTPPIPKKRSTANLPKQDQIARRKKKNGKFNGASSSDMASGTSGASGTEDDHSEPRKGNWKEHGKTSRAPNTRRNKAQQNTEYSKNVSTINVTQTAEETNKQTGIDIPNTTKSVAVENTDSPSKESKHRIPKRKPARGSLKRKSADLANSFDNSNQAKPFKDESLGAIPKNSKSFLPQTAEQLDEEIANSVGPYYQRQYFPVESQGQKFPNKNSKNLLANGSADGESSDSSLRETKGRMLNKRYQKNNILSTHDHLIKSCPEEITILKYHSFKDGMNVKGNMSDEDRSPCDSDDDSCHNNTMNSSLGRVTDV